MVIGELALGNFSRRDEVITLLSDLSPATEARHVEVVQLIDSQQLSGKGSSLVDVHLLAATLLTPDMVLWARDKRLQAAAVDAGVRWPDRDGFRHVSRRRRYDGSRVRCDPR